MRNRLTAILNSRNGFRLMMMATLLCAVGTITFLSAAPAATTAITIENNSSWQIQHLYLSPANDDNWSADQLSGPISAGQTVTLNITWNQSVVKLVSEDQDGCFLYNTIDATVDGLWTITNDATRNCGN
jgi:hypothetical protein